MDATLANPFRIWTELARGLKDRFVKELGEQPRSAYSGEVLGMMAALVTHCQHLGSSLQRLSESDPEAYDAFLRALEKS